MSEIMPVKESSFSFEEAVTRLEAIVKELEDGRLPLERALDLFAEGIKLSKVCNRNLEEAEQRISILTKDEKGGIVLKEIDSFDPGEA
ncbi:MAG: exodeoxyribonuclease VII small subunit [Desulfotomaculaceae bacterium]|nr:exodeoxyribonuclease VII small subunit [Desulfotomaculaceae bacterium]